MCGKKIQTTKKRRTKSRGNGTGCAYYDADHRYWVAQIVTGYRELPPFSPDNPENRKSRIPIKKTKSGFKRREDALAYCQELKNQKPALPNKTLKEIYDLWDPWYSPRVDPDTFGCYRAAFAYFKPLHGNTVREITAGELQACLDNCPRGHRTHQNMKVTAGLLWAYAIDHNFAEKDVTENLYIGKGASVQREPLDDMEVERIRQQIGKERYASYVYALCYLGFRPGEMLEIKKSQVTEHNGTLFITEGKKTDAGRDRIVPVHEKIRPIIEQQLALEGTEYLFPMHIYSRKGEFKGYKVMTDNYFNKFAFRPLANKLKIPANKVPYSARHTFSDKLKKADGTDKVKASLIGHSDYRFTQQKYQSTNLDELQQAMASIK
jgi:integrase